jgi:hypothetical protein
MTVKSNKKASIALSFSLFARYSWWTLLLLRFEVLAAVKMSMLVFWAVRPCGLAGSYRDDGGRLFLRNVGNHPQGHTASQPTKSPSTSFVPSSSVVASICFSRLLFAFLCVIFRRSAAVPTVLLPSVSCVWFLQEWAWFVERRAWFVRSTLKML